MNSMKTCAEIQGENMEVGQEDAVGALEHYTEELSFHFQLFRQIFSTTPNCQSDSLIVSTVWEKLKQNTTVDSGEGENNTPEVMELAAEWRHSVAGNGVWEIHDK